MDLLKIALYLLLLIFYSANYLTIVFVAYHFITKFW